MVCDGWEDKFFPLKILSAIVIASAPLRRMMPKAPSPGGVARATIVVLIVYIGVGAKILYSVLRCVPLFSCTYFLLSRQKKVRKKRRPLKERSALCGQAIRCFRGELPLDAARCAGAMGPEDFY